MKFKSLLIEDQKQRLKDKSIDCEIIDISEIKNIENYYGLYPTVGENLDYLNLNNLKVDFFLENNPTLIHYNDEKRQIEWEDYHALSTRELRGETGGSATIWDS